MCFFCKETVSKHYLGDCEKFKRLSLERRREVVIDAKKCLNCLGLGHFARDCRFVSKCPKCGPSYHNKHATVFRDCYVRPNYVNFEATETNKESEHVIARKISPTNKIVLLRTSAVKVNKAQLFLKVLRTSLD